MERPPPSFFAAPRRTLPVLLALALGTVGSALLARAVQRSEEAALHRAVDAEAANIVARIGEQFQTRLFALERMADRWRLSAGTSEAVWTQDASNNIAHFGGFRAIARLSADGHVQWVVPDIDAARVGADLGTEPARREAMDEAWRTLRPIVSPPVKLLDGGMGVLVYLPLFIESRFDGWLTGVFEVSQLLGVSLRPLDAYHLRLSTAETVIYDTLEPTDGVCSARAVGVFDLGWRAEVCASAQLERDVHEPFPELALALGLAFTGLVGGLLYALQLAGEREHEARALAARLRAKANALERAQRELAELSWSVSHEIRTPLRAIDGYAAILAQEGAPEARPALERIRANAQRMGRQLDGLLELLRVARTEPRVAPVNVSALARRRIATLVAAAPARHVHVHVDDGIEVLGDPALLTTVLDALLENAWKFTAMREEAHISVLSRPRGFCVQDDGVGFDMAFVDKLFATFERLHAPGEFEGLGLGLAIAARAVGRHGGRIWAEGAPEKGARFYVELPP